MTSPDMRVASSDEIQANKLFSTTINGTRLLLSRVDGTVHAVVDRCPHLGMPMRKGKIEGNIVTCPFHGSTFDIVSGENQDWVTGVMGKPMPQWACKMISLGKKPSSLWTVSVAERDGEVLVGLPNQ
jgi:nitrite reductase/ring-hydroxylating ferredoxin subunit